MGFYLRKAFRLGPLRINLSKSGLGVSAGVKGARVGVDAQGKSYVHVGRGGLYFRKRLGEVDGCNAGRGSIAWKVIIWVILILLVALGVFLFA